MIVATAGHVDHGKTFLVKNLTGVDTDRLEEERRRGLTISLGYAYWRPDDRTVVGFIDVPGHRRFINNMISGISGIDLGMLVVAADDGPMPQTREHLQVMELLGVEHYLLVVSKCDRVDEDRVDRVVEETAALLPADTDVFRVSNTTCDGIDELRDHLGNLGCEWTARQSSGHFRMSTDRAFHLQGSGLVLTGTIASGRVAVGDRLMLQPQAVPLRVRSIHTQDAPAESGSAGDRCALNVSGDVHRDDIERGDWVVDERCIGTTDRFDARVRLLPDAAFPLKHLAQVKLHIGAKYLEARMVLLRGEGDRSTKLLPGQSALAQFVTERPVLCCHGDRFLLRDYGETATLGGGVVLDPVGLGARRATPSRIAYLEAMDCDDIERAIGEAVAQDCILDMRRLLEAWNFSADKRTGVSLPGITRIEVPSTELWLSDERWAGILDQVLETLSRLHEENPDNPGVQEDQLEHAALPASERRPFPAAVEALIEAGKIRSDGGLLAASSFHPASAEQDEDWLAILEVFARHGRQIPSLKQLREESGLDPQALRESLGMAQRDRRVLKVNAERYAIPAVLREYARAALDVTADKREMTVAELRDAAGCGRNLLIEVLEYFDSIGFTRRVGNARVIIDRDLPAKKFPGS